MQAVKVKENVEHWGSWKDRKAQQAAKMLLLITLD
jgi:hypothetical protein